MISQMPAISFPPFGLPIAGQGGGVTAVWQAWLNEMRNALAAAQAGVVDGEYVVNPDASGELDTVFTQAQLAALVAQGQELFAQLQETQLSALIAQGQELIFKLQDAVGMLPQPPRGTMAETNLHQVPYLTFDGASPSLPTATGSLYWDQADGNKTLSLVMQDSGGVIQQIGEETYYRIKADADITNGQVVMFTGSVGASGALKGAPATGVTADQVDYIMGVATMDMAHNDWGYVTWFGIVRGVDTTGGAEAWTDGTVLYYNPAVTGGLTKNKPALPNPIVLLAAVVNAASNGTLFIRPTYKDGTGIQITSPPITKTANFSITDGESWVINNKSGSTCTVTLPAANAITGRVIHFQNYQAQYLVSASSNVVPIAGGAAGTAILANVAGDRATLVSDGSNWIITQYVPNNVLLLE